MHLERFDFEGRLVSMESGARIGMHEGLHHHGDQPAAAGYTLAELMRLSRSTVPAQRVQALRMLALLFGGYPPLSEGERGEDGLGESRGDL